MRDQLLIGCFAAVAGVGCGGPWLDPTQPVRRIAVTDVRAEGLSGTARHADGSLWAVSEEGASLYRFNRLEPTPALVRVPIEGLVSSLELESMAWLDGEHVAIGTERDGTRAHDLVLVARVGRSAQLLSAWRVPWYRLWGMSAHPNQGVEGLCAAAGFVLMAGETVMGDRDGRWAPVARARWDGRRLGRWTPFRVRLTTRTGKLSSLSCDVDEGDEIEAFGIERHYGITRILRFEVPAAGPVGDLAPEVVADFGGHLESLPNMEGVSVHGGQLIIVTDHERRHGAGTTETILLGPLNDD